MEKKILEQVINHMYGLIIVDSEGRLLFIEKSYAQNMGIDPKEDLGRSVLELIPNSLLPHVARTGTPILGKIFHTKKKPLLCNRFPLYENQKPIGAFSYWTFEVTEQLVETIRNLEEELNHYKKKSQYEAPVRYSLVDIIGSSATIRRLRSTILTATSNRSTVLIQGETGTGKELVAHSLHQESRFSSQPFVKINCAAIPADLIESELFGYEEGAFTGARKSGFKGKFEQANRGTIFLDEISQLSLSAQSKLLRAIQEKEIERLGGSKTIPIDVRVIACTNDDLKEMVDKRLFRADLFFRLNVIPIEVPPLHEHLEDIPELVDFFAAKYSKILGLGKVVVEPEVYSLLRDYSWPGNVRELEHAIERALNFSQGDRLKSGDFPWLMIKTKASSNPDMKQQKKELERQLILEALERSRGNKSVAAKKLGITRAYLYQKIKKYEIE